MLPEMLTALTTINTVLQPYYAVIVTLVGFIVYGFKGQVSTLLRASQQHGEDIAVLKNGIEDLKRRLAQSEERLYDAITRRGGQADSHHG